MIANESAARLLSQRALDAVRLLDEALAKVQPECTSEDFTRARRATGVALAAIYDELLSPIYKQHPELKPSGFP